MTSETDDPQVARSTSPFVRSDVIGGAAVVFVAVLVWFGAIGLDLGAIASFRAGALPKALSVILSIAGGLLLLRGFTRDDDEDLDEVALAIRPMLMVTLAMLSFGLFIRGGHFWFLSTPQLGLAVVAPVNVFLAGCATSKVRVREVLVLAFALTAVVLVVFPDLLGVSIPVFPTFAQNVIPPSLGTDAAIRILVAIYGGISVALYLVFFKLRGAA